MYAEMLKAKEHELPQILQRILQDVWDTEVIPDTWKRGTIIRLPKNGICPNVATRDSSHYCPPQARFSATSFSYASQQQWTNYYAKNKQASGRGKSCIYHIFVVFLNSHMNGTALCTWCSWTLRMLFTAYTDHRSGIFYGTMESRRNW